MLAYSLFFYIPDLASNSLFQLILEFKRVDLKKKLTKIIQEIFNVITQLT